MPGPMGMSHPPPPIEGSRFGGSPGDFGGGARNFAPRNPDFRSEFPYSPYGHPGSRPFYPPNNWTPYPPFGSDMSMQRDDRGWYNSRPVEIGEHQQNGDNVEGPSDPASAPTAPSPPPPPPIMRITVAGRDFDVARAVLAKYPELSFAAAVSNGDAAVTLDDDPALFEILLGLLRTNRLFVPHGVKLASVLAFAKRLGVHVPDDALQAVATGRALRFTRSTTVTLHTNVPRNKAVFTLFPGDELRARRDHGEGTLLVRVRPQGSRDKGEWSVVERLPYSIVCGNVPTVVQFQGENTYREPIHFPVHFTITLAHDPADEA